MGRTIGKKRTTRHVTKVPRKLCGMGVASVYDPHKFPHIAQVLCAEYGFTCEQLGRVFGVSKRTVEAWSRLYPEFKEAVKTGRRDFDTQHVEQALLKRALGFEYEERTTKHFYIDAKRKSDDYEFKLPAKEITITKKFCPPETKAAMYWLTNRMPEDWKMAININASIENKDKPKLSVRADLANMGIEQLKALRDIINSQEQNVIEVNPTQALLPMETILEKAQKVYDATIVE